MPECFWDMQHNKHFESNFRQTLFIFFLVQPGWSPGITVCLSASGICYIIHILGLNFRQMYIFFRFTQVGVLASLFAWSLLVGICNIQSHTKIDDIFRTFSEGSPSNLVKKKGFLSCYPYPLFPPKQSYLKHKPLKKNSLVRSPALAYVVRISQVGTRIKLEVLTLVQLGERIFFTLIHSTVQIYEFHIFIISSSSFPAILRTNLMTSSQLAC